jgi:cytochrome c biogenesis protein CcdA
MELGQLLENSTIPLVTALLLGIQTAICPCPMTTNITAIGYIGKDIENRKFVFWKGLFFALGNIIAYTGLAFILIPVIRKGLSTYSAQKVISEVGTIILPIVFILFGLGILFIKKLNLPSISIFKKDGKRMEENAGKGYFGAFLLGIVLAFAFCPTTGLIYFGMLLPMSALQPNGYFLPVVYSLASALPVVVIAWIMAFGISRIGKFFDKAKSFNKWLTYFVALAFIGVGVYFAVRLFI